MYRAYGPHFHGLRSMAWCFWGPCDWHRPSIKERLEWFQSSQEKLGCELEEVEKELDELKKHEANWPNAFSVCLESGGHAGGSRMRL